MSKHRAAQRGPAGGITWQNHDHDRRTHTQHLEAPDYGDTTNYEYLPRRVWRGEVAVVNPTVPFNIRALAEKSSQTPMRSHCFGRRAKRASALRVSVFSCFPSHSGPNGESKQDQSPKTRTTFSLSRPCHGKLSWSCCNMYWPHGNMYCCPDPFKKTPSPSQWCRRPHEDQRTMEHQSRHLSR